LFSIDDHELIDDWVELDPEHPDAELRSERLKTRTDGRDAFIEQMKINNIDSNETYYEYCVNGIPVFVMDSRTERLARRADTIRKAKMISDKQMSLLCKWIEKCAEQDKGKPDSQIAPKIIMSGSMLLPRLRSTAKRWEVSPASCLRSDGWDGYPRTMHHVLSHILNSGLRKVIFVSGDAHIPCLCKARISSKAHGAIDIVSVHASGLNAPLPFANTMAEEFQSFESFVLRSMHSGSNNDRDGDTDFGDTDYEDPLDITVNTYFPEVGDGFCTIRTSYENGWQPCKISFAGKLTNYVPVPFGEV